LPVTELDDPREISAIIGAEQVEIGPLALSKPLPSTSRPLL
jgi:hypothetical protein